MAAFFSTRTPQMLTARAARQIGKSRSLAARLLLRSASFPGYKSLVVLPLQEQSDRLSDQVFRPMIEDSPIRVKLQDDLRAAPGSIRRRAFSNRSIINFGYAYLTAERLRGVDSRELDIDEAQDVNPQHMPVIRECQSSFTEPVTLMTGTSKTLDTLLNSSWNKSSQAVWHTRCGCGYDNRAIVEDGDLLAMLGPYRDDISEKAPGTVCARCQRPINPRTGRWVHRCPERAHVNAGYNLPQVIFPFHYAHPQKWADVLAKRDSRAAGYNQARFYNEVLGEPYEFATRLLSTTEIKKACRDFVNTLEAAVRRAQGHAYELIVLGVDWGGGGVDGGSQTRVAAAGFAADGGVDVFYGATMPFGLDAVDEANEVFKIAAALRVGYIAHDFNGAGSAREAVLTHMDWPIENIAPMVYAEIPGAKTVRYVPATGARYRGFYHLGKARSLQFVAAAVRRGLVRFYEYDHRGDDDPGLLHDFNNYVEHRITSPTGRSVYQVRAVNDTATTDFADAANMAISFTWESMQAWPSLKA
jgi:hypothetical protein